MAKHGWLALHRNEFQQGQLGSDIYIDHGGERLTFRLVQNRGLVSVVAFSGPQSFVITRDDAKRGEYDRDEVRGEVP